MLLSICMMVKNEEKYLDRCLKSLQPLREAVDSELIIVDTGSTDNTVEIAKRYTEKVYFQKWNNDFSEMRNITINYSTGKWFFYIDGDEIMYNSEEMISFLNSNLSEKYNSASVVIKNITNENNPQDASIFSAVRLMKKYSGFCFKGAIHNQPIYNLPTHDLSTSFLHYGYISTDKELMEKKFKRTATILKRELEKNPNDIYYWYQLSVSYTMHNEYDKAIKPIEKSYKLLRENKACDLMYVYTQLALVYLMNKQYEKCVKICMESIEVKDEYIDIYYYLANSQAMLEYNDEAIKNYKNYIKILEKYDKNLIKDKTSINYTLGKKDEVYKNLLIVYSKQKKYSNALEYAKKIESENMVNSAMPNIINAFLNSQDYLGIKKYFKINLSDNKVLKNRFYIVLEELNENLKKDEKVNLFKEFSNETAYGILSNVRLDILNNNFNISVELFQNISSLNFEDLNSFYGDILYYLLKTKEDISKIIKIRENQFIRFIEYIVEKYKDINEVMYDYLICNKFSNLNSIRINKIFERTLLILDKLEDDKYKEVFYRFINDGVTYIRSIYSNKVLETEMIYDLKNQDEEFLLYMYKAEQVRKSDIKLYINYLKQALEAYPYMRKGIEILKEDLEKELNPITNELEQYKIQIKDTIKNLISNGDLNNSKVLIKEYEEIVQDDMEIVLFKSEIALKEIQMDSSISVSKYKM